MKNSNHQNFSESFRELNLSDLKKYAEEWVETFPNTIEKICLYNYSPPLRIMAALEESAGGRFSVMYAIVFEVYDLQKVFEFFLDNPIGDYSFCELSEIQNKALLDYKALKNATGKNTTLKNKATYRPLIRNRFSSVYKDQPKDDFLNQWTFIHKLPNEGLSPHVRVSEGYWVLYEAKEKQHQISARSKAEQVKEKYPQEVIDLLEKAKPEIEDLYTGMKGNWQEPDQENEETYGGNLRYAAEEWFDKVSDTYEIIKNKHVISSHLYISNTEQDIPDLTHPSRDFKGKLCQVLISDAFPKYVPNPIPKPAPNRFGVKALHDLLKSL